ncbi:MAG: GxxExxY protein [Muribaculaceae bacterium]|nr:GxxExxY protein [Muribaculaceae bacterium]
MENLSYELIGAAFEVRNCLGGYLHETAYEAALHYELFLRGITSERQVSLPVIYKGLSIHNPYRIDIVVEGKIIVELKSLPAMSIREVGQLLNYMQLSHIRLGYLINFGATDFCTASTPSDRKEILPKGIYRYYL